MRLFISYAHVDIYLVRTTIVDILRAAQYDPWFDHNLLPGQDWQEALLKAIMECDAFIYAVTPESAKSDWCIWEFTEAVKARKSVVPVLLQKTELPSFLEAIQYVDFTNGPTGDAVARLLGGLQQVPIKQVEAILISPTGIPSQAVDKIEQLTRKSRLLPLFEIAYNGLTLSDFIPSQHTFTDDERTREADYEFQSQVDTIRLCGKQVFEEEDQAELIRLLSNLNDEYNNYKKGILESQTKEPFPLLIVVDRIERFISNIQPTLSGKSLAAYTAGEILARWSLEPLHEHEAVPRTHANHLKYMVTAITRDSDVIELLDKQLNQYGQADPLDSSRWRIIREIYGTIKSSIVFHDLHFLDSS